MSGIKLPITIFIFTCPIWVFAFFATLKFNMTIPQYHPYVLEGGVLEIITELNYLISAFLAFYIFYNFKKMRKKLLKYLYFLLSLGLLWIFLEEISYGQRLFNLEVPEFFKENNRQEEINFHNLVGLGFTKSMWIFKFLIGVYGTFSLFLATKFLSKKYHEIASWICPQYILIPCFITIIMHYTFVDLIIGGKPEIDRIWDKFFKHFHGHEITELIISFGFIFFLTINMIRLRAIKNNEH